MTLAPARPVLARGPNWYATVMGTGIIATAGASLPFRVPGLIVVWVVAAVLLVGVTVLVGRPRVSGDLVNFWGAPPIALLTVGAGAVVFGFVVAGALLWVAGTVFGLVVAVLVPPCREGEPFGGWLMPVVPPIVSAASGALLVPHVPAGLRFDLLVTCYALALFGITAAAPVLLKVVRAPVRLVPTQWIVLGPLGQSVTALLLLAGAAESVLTEPYGRVAGAVAVLYAVPVMGFALVWLAIAAARTLRAVRAGLPFAMTWWSFTFPVGTLVTASSAFGARTGSVAATVLGVVLYAFLVAAWMVVGVRTARGFLTGAL